MWPPRSPGLRLARTTIAIAFQRMIERMRHSIAASPGDLRFLAGGNGVDVFGGRRERQVRTGAAGELDHAFEQLVRARGAVVVDDRLDRLDPLAGLGGVGIVLQQFVQPVHCGAPRDPLAAHLSSD